MRSLRNLTGISKIFKYHDFTNDAPEKKEEGPVLKEAPYLRFEDEDVKAKPLTQELSETPEIPAQKGISEEERLRLEAEENARQIVQKARADAESILEEARKKGEELEHQAENRGQEQGYQAGYEEGKQAGEDELLAAVSQKYSNFFGAIEEACKNIEEQKKEILQRYLKDLSDLTLAMAEKVIHVALESCGEVIKRMIVSAVTPATEKQWAKLTISSQDVDIMKEDGINIRQTLAAISDKIEIVIVEEAPQGTCLVEFPDQVIDAGAGTQIKNIKEMVRYAEKE